MVLKKCRVVIPEIHGKRILKELYFGQFDTARIKSIAHIFIWWLRIDYIIEDIARNRSVRVNV